MKRKESIENTQKLSLRIDKDLHKKLRLLSVQENVSMNLLVEEMIRDGLRRKNVDVA